MREKTIRESRTDLTWPNLVVSPVEGAATTQIAEREGIGDVTPDNEYQTREDKAAGRPVRQKLDQVTGKRRWKATVTDPDEPNAKRASFEMTFVADVQPVPTTTEVLPGMRPIELDGLTAEPKVAGSGRWREGSAGRPASLRPSR